MNCKIDGCDRTDIRQSGFCTRHHQRKLLDERPPCAVVGCEKKQYAKRMCAMHYGRFKRGTDLGGVLQREPTMRELDAKRSAEVLKKILGGK